MTEDIGLKLPSHTKERDIDYSLFRQNDERYFEAYIKKHMPDRFEKFDVSKPRIAFRTLSSRLTTI